MKKTIYAKYSNDRSDKFKILTRIVEENGKKHVEKVPLAKAAETHLSNIHKWYEQLNELFVDEELHINKCSYENLIVKLEYINGITLEEKMLNLYASEKFDELYELFDRYVEKLNKLATEEFKTSAEFEKMFGEISIDAGSKSMKVTDIDIIFSNILIDDAGWQIIDYEWTFDFLIPIRFVLYRAIMSFSNVVADYPNAKDLKLLNRVGISEEEEKIYQSMEKAFQQYVKDGYFSLSEMYQEYGKRNISVWEAVEIDNYVNTITTNNKFPNTSDNLKEYIREKEAELQMLKEENNRLNNTLNDIYKSKKWRLVTKLAKLRTGGR